MTMELDHAFSLAYSFHWDEPISDGVQHAIARFGTDEDRIRLAGHPSVTPEALEALASVPYPEVQVAVTMNPATPAEALARMAGDRSRLVRSAANEAIDRLDEPQREAARALVKTRVQRLKSRLGA